MSRRFPDHRQQSGFALLEAMIAVTILTWWMFSIGGAFQAWGNYQVGQMEGNRVAKYNSAVASYVANEPARLAKLDQDYMDLLPENHNGIGWLQVPPCGDGFVAYLPCSFDPFSRVGLTFNTNIVLDGGYIRATTNLGPAITGKGVDRTIGGIIVNSASAYVPTYTANMEQAYGITSYDIAVDTGNLTATVDSAALASPFLLINGKNQMTGDLNTGGNNIINANNITAANNVSTRNVTATNNITASNNVSAGNDVTANTAGNGGDVKLANTQVNPGQADSQDGPISLSHAPQGATYARNNSYVTKIACPEGESAHVFTQSAQISNNGVAEPIGAITYGYEDDAAHNRWRVFYKLAVASSPNWVTPTTDATIYVHQWCQ